MNRPYVICHILSSLDGRIDGAFFAMPETVPALRAFAKIRDEFSCQAALNGTVTAAEIYADGYVESLPEAAKNFPRTDWIAPHEEKQYAVALDEKGMLNWRGGSIRRSGRKPQHAVAILTEQVSDNYLAFLREKHVSYLFAGRDTLDLPLALRKLKEVLAIERLLLSGGGVIDWAMLQAGLLDEVSLVIAPVADGSIGAATLFDQSPFAAGQVPRGLRLMQVRQEDGGAVWLNYQAEGSTDEDA